MKVGDLACIWTGEGPIGDPGRWVFGIVVNEKPRRITEVDGTVLQSWREFQVHWANGVGLDCWHTADELSLENLPANG